MEAKLTPYIHCAGNAAEAIEYYVQSLGLAVTRKYQFDENNPRSGEIMHAELESPGINFFVCDMPHGQPVTSGSVTSLFLDFATLEGAREGERKLIEGNTVIEPLTLRDWGAYFGIIVDRFGVAWEIHHYPQPGDKIMA